MSALRNLRIGARLALAFSALLLLLCAVAGFGTSQTAKINDNVVDLSSNWLASVQLLGDIRTLANVARRGSMRHVLESEPAQKREAQAARDAAVDTKFPAAVAAYEKTVTSPEEKKLLDSIKTLWAAYLVQDKKMLELSNAGDASFTEARKFSVGPANAAIIEVGKVIDEDIKLNVAGSVAATESAAASYRNALSLNAVAVVFALVVGVAMAFAITRSIVTPIAQAVGLADTVARGDLTSKVSVVGKDEPALLLASLMKMNDSLVAIVGQVRQTSDSIATGSGQIATGNADLSQRTEEQASNLQQTAASMEELTSTVKSNADTARLATQLANSASGAAERGGVVVGQVVHTMEAITSSSKKISDIIGVIDGIAFQTNILALNAAVEAARAGEQGRGFAVVASEVRSLAQRSAAAAKEIKGLINDSVEKVEAGSQQVGEAGSAMSDIVAQVKRVNDLIGEISSATQEQTQGISQVGDAVSQLDQVTQQNAALVEESAAAADSLSQQAVKLVEAMSMFTLRPGATPAAAH
jgi:methyl-accepting chemotaxis protein